MTNELRRLAQECKDIRGLPPSWYDFDTLAITYGIGHTDALFIAAAPPGAVIAMLNEIDALKAELGDLPDAQAEMLREIKALRGMCGHYEAALKCAFPEGSNGQPFWHWNQARLIATSLDAAIAAAKDAAT